MIAQADSGPELRVLHVITRLIVGGAQENTLLTAIGQHRTPGMRVTLLAGIDDGPEGNLHAERARCRCRAGADEGAGAADRAGRRRHRAGQAGPLFQRGRFDIVHTHSSKAGIIGRIAAKMAGTPIVVHTLHSLVFGEHASALRNALYVRLKRLCAPMTDTLISVCDATKNGAIAARIGRPEQHVTVFSGFHIEPFLRVRETLDVAEAKRRIGLQPSDLVVGKVARLSPQKGHDYFVEAARIIAAAEPRARFVLVGDGILRGEIEETARRHGILDRFVFTGLVPPDAVPPLMQAMDVVVHTSIREGLARVIPQGAAVGKPVVGFALDGTPEAIADGISGYLAKPFDAADVAAKVLAILPDEAVRRRMGEAGRQFAAANFPVEVMVQRINAIYRELARERLPARRFG